MRLIDADVLCEGRVCNDPVVIAIKCAPTIDVVEVVRCKDCEEYIPWLDGKICGRIGSYYGNTKPNDFCSRGVKRTNAKEEDHETD